MNRLPCELVEQIAHLLSSPKDVSHLASVNKHCRHASIRPLFKFICLSSPAQYARFVGHLEVFSQRYWLMHVRTLDLSSYTTRGTRKSHKESVRIIEPDVIVALILACENLQEILLNEYVMTETVAPVILRAILTRHRRLKLVDMSACCGQSVASATAHVFDVESEMQNADPRGGQIQYWKLTEPQDEFERNLKRASQAVSKFALENILGEQTPPLCKISFFMCTALSQQTFFKPFFQRLAADGNHLTHLDLGHTKITNETLDLLNPANLTHLSLKGCYHLTCCTGLCAFLRRCTRLEQLNLNMEASGMATAVLCWQCLLTIALTASTVMPNLTVLDLGGHSHMDDTIITQLLMRNMERIKGLSLAHAKISLDTLSRVLEQMPSLHYLDVSRCTCMLDTVDAMQCLGKVRETQIQVLEVAMAFPLTYDGWSLTEYNMHHYYSRDDIDPRFWYSRKLLLGDSQPRSPMLQHWGYSFCL